MMAAKARSHSRAEVVFVLLRVLVTGRLLWGGSLSLAALRPLMGADASQVSRALDYLCREGLVFVDRRRGTVRLTEHGIREFSG